MKQITCDARWHEAYLDTPFNVPQHRVDRAHARRDPDDLLDVPGVHLKTRELDSEGFAQMFGRLVHYSDSTVVVRSKADCLNDNLKCVWVGTAAEYVRMWMVD